MHYMGTTLWGSQGEFLKRPMQQRRHLFVDFDGVFHSDGAHFAVADMKSPLADLHAASL